MDLTKSSRPTEMSAEPGQAASEESAWAPPTSPIRKSNVSSRTGCVTILPTQFTPPTARSSPYNLSGRYTSNDTSDSDRNAVFSLYFYFLEYTPLWIFKNLKVSLRGERYHKIDLIYLGTL